MRSVLNHPFSLSSTGTLFSKVFLGIIFISSLLACQNPKVNEQIYGKWHEPVEGGGIELRPDGTAIWYGEEGSFEVSTARVSAITCGISVLGCYYGDVSITVGDRVYQTRYYDRILNANIDTWTMRFEDTINTPSGRQVTSLRMRRVDEITGPQTHRGFTKMDAGLQDYYTGDGAFFHVAEHWVRRHFDTELSTLVLYLWDEDDERWHSVGPAAQAQVTRNFHIGLSLIYATDGHYSLDGGLTFQPTLALTDIPFDIDNADDAEIVDTVILNQEVISLARITRNDEISNEIWGLDLTQAQPTWTRRHHFADGDFSAYLLVAPVANTLIIGWLNDEGPIRSLDGGYTWNPIALEGTLCEDNILVNAHPVGCWCATQENRYVYDARQDRWMTFAQGGWSNQMVGITQASLADEYPLFIIENGRLVLVDWNGVRTSTIQIDEDIDGWRLQVFSERLLYPHYALWSAPFAW